VAKAKKPGSSAARRSGAKLKVFRTPIGFHDAYVAAPSMKAALEAWGSSTNLFSQGAAELVTDPKLTRAPLARPGEVVRVPRGSEGEHFKALGRTKKKGPSPQPSPARGRGGKKKGRRPSSAAVERAEKALASAEAKHRAALEKLRAEAAAIDKKRRELERKQRGERERLMGELDEAREKFRSAMEEWAG
jgi:hypothetical protein